MLVVIGLILKACNKQSNDIIKYDTEVKLEMWKIAYDLLEILIIILICCQLVVSIFVLILIYECLYLCTIKVMAMINIFAH